MSDPAPAGVAPPRRLVVHIGAGKTGTTSIQRCLHDNRTRLAARGVAYLGLMLEHAPVRRFEWQAPGAIQVLERLGPDVGAAQVLEVLRESAPLLDAAGCRTLVWSNESFFNHDTVVRPALLALAAEGWAPELLAYVRRHDRWIKSAYVQWALKHKVDAGHVPTFPRWCETHRPRFSKALLRWIEATGFPCSVRNFDEAGDVVEDFLRWLGLPAAGLTWVRTNDTPGPEELVLRALFNDLHSGPLLPQRFNELLLGGWRVGNRSVHGLLDAYLPREEDLEEIVGDSLGEIAEINRLLEASGQPGLDPLVADSAPPEVDMGKIVALLFEMIVRQARRIEALEQAQRGSG
jgi:hypothetical protein